MFTVISAVTVSDPLEQLVRHFLLETGPRGVKIKGCQNEPYFGKFSCKDNVKKKLKKDHSFFFVFLLFLSRSNICVAFLLSTGSLSALVYQHAITPISLPCALKITEKGQYSQYESYWKRSLNLTLTCFKAKRFLFYLFQI